MVDRACPCNELEGHVSAHQGARHLHNRPRRSAKKFAFEDSSLSEVLVDHVAGKSEGGRRVQEHATAMRGGRVNPG